MPPGRSWERRLRAYAVHLYTAAGVVFAFLAAAAICAERVDPRLVFFWLALALGIDASDGALARRWDVKQLAPRISGRAMDDIVDYLTYTFLPLLLVWRQSWVPAPAGVWVCAAMIASLFGFANKKAKEDEHGFFVGFPSYWNIYAYYAGLLQPRGYATASGLLLLLLALLTVLPLRFAYPNRARRPWGPALLWGGGAWTILLLALLPWYPNVLAWIIWSTLAYPAFYLIASIWLQLSPTPGR